MLTDAPVAAVGTYDIELADGGHSISCCGAFDLAWTSTQSAAADPKQKAIIVTPWVLSAHAIADRCDLRRVHHRAPARVRGYGRGLPRAAPATAAPRRAEITAARVVGGRRVPSPVHPRGDLASTCGIPTSSVCTIAAKHDGQLWISMDYVDGARRGPSPGRIATQVACQSMKSIRIVTAVASALDYAHKQGLLHRDVKPANIMLTHLSTSDEQRILLTDFGIARNLDDISGLTATNMTVGTVAYSAPSSSWARRSTGGGPVRPCRHGLPLTDRVAALPALQSCRSHQPPPQLGTASPRRRIPRAGPTGPSHCGGVGQRTQASIRALFRLRECISRRVARPRIASTIEIHGAEVVFTRVEQPLHRNAPARRGGNPENKRQALDCVGSRYLSCRGRHRSTARLAALARRRFTRRAT